MKFLLILSLILKSIAIGDYLSFLSHNTISRDRVDDLFDIMAAIERFIDKNSDIRFIDSPECIDQILTEMIDDNKTAFYSYISYSGKGYGDFGRELECIKSKYDYHLFLLTFKEGRLDTMFDKQVIDFINKRDSYIGICFPLHCSVWIDNLFNSTINHKLFDKFIPSEESILASLTNTRLTESKSISIGEQIIFSMLFFIIFIQILGSIINQLTLAVRTIHKKRKTVNKDEEHSAEYYYLSDDSKEKEDKPEMVIFTQLSKSVIESPKSLTWKDYFIKFFSNVNIIHNLKLLLSKKNMCYDGYDLELFSFIQSILMFLMIFNQNLLTIVNIPIRSYNDQDFYQSVYFFFIMLSSYSFNCWIVLDGMIMMYKFMSYLKEHIFRKGRGISIKCIGKFYLLSLSKIIPVSLLFFVFHYNADTFVYYSSGGDALYTYYINKIYKDIPFSQIVSALIPFYSLVHYDYITEVYEEYPYIITAVNEFYAFTLILLLFYIGIKLKVKIYDFIILGVVIINVGLSYFTVRYEAINNDTQLRLNYILMNQYTGKNFHLLFNVYFFGVIGGMILFYFKDAIEKEPMTGSKMPYLPYHYCDWINRKFFSLVPHVKIFLLIIVLILEILLSFIFTIVVNANSSLTIPITTTVKVLYFMFPIIFSLLFLMMIILIKLIVSTQGFWSHFVNFNVFRFIFRVKLAFFSSFDCLIFAYYCRFKFQLKLSYDNMLLISLGLFIFCIFNVTFFTLAFEFPIRLLIKYLTNDKKQIVETRLIPIET